MVKIIIGMGKVDNKEDKIVETAVDSSTRDENKKTVKRVLKAKNSNKVLKKHVDKEVTIFSRFALTPDDVYQDATESGVITENPKLPKKKKKFNKQVLSWGFILLNIVIVAILFVKQSLDGGIKPISELFAEAPYYRFLFLGFGFMILSLFIEGLKFFQLIRHATGKNRPWFAQKVAVIGRYWDCITPFGSGGQPFQIYYMSKDGYKAETATGVPLAKYLFWQVAFCIIGLIVICFPSEVTDVANVVKYLAWVGIIGNIFIFLFNFSMSTSNRFGGKIVNGLLKFATKIRIVKNYDTAYEKVNNTFKNYQTTIKKFSKSPIQVISQVIYSALTILLHASIAYCVYLAFNYADILSGVVVAKSWLEIVSLSILCDVASSLVPMPGGSGAAELSFMGLFGAMFKPDMAFWAMLFWRLFTYYGIILCGLILIVWDSIVRMRKRKKEYLVAESEEIAN
ncbi:MAG: flippase-like domain-containing protein [Clostridia bacterium]|nr:flippase-like domain-containing protein [Clostridia bacterium]